MYLVFDTGSPIASLALGEAGGQAKHTRVLPQKRTSERLLASVDDLLGEAGMALAQIDGLVALRGPGSFTGLRIGLATAYGLHQATGLRVAAMPTLEALGAVSDAGSHTVALVDALRGEWFAQSFVDRAASPPFDRPEVIGVARLAEIAFDEAVGFGLEAIDPFAARRVVTPRNLAAEVLRGLRPERLEWTAEALLEPLYLRPPATTRPPTIRQP